MTIDVLLRKGTIEVSDDITFRTHCDVMKLFLLGRDCDKRRTVRPCLGAAVDNWRLTVENGSQQETDE